MPREHEGYSSARVIRRSRLFFTVPVAIIIVISVYFVWEVVRANLNSHTLDSWPFRFTIMDDSTTATVLVVFISLFMGRLQWARALRPVVGIAIDDEGAQFRADSTKWRVWIYNSGPGAAVFDSVRYYVRFVDTPESEGDADWVALPVFNDQLRSRRFADGLDYFMRWNTRGAPFPVVSNYSDGMQIAWFTVDALKQMRFLDIRMRYIDSLGDIHEKITPVIQRLPSVAVTAVRNAPSRPPSAP
jgi:hypothetical protein